MNLSMFQAVVSLRSSQGKTTDRQITVIEGTVEHNGLKREKQIQCLLIARRAGEISPSRGLRKAFPRSASEAGKFGNVPLTSKAHFTLSAAFPTLCAFSYSTVVTLGVGVGERI